MDPATLLNNAATFVTALLVPTGLLCLPAALIIWGYSRLADDPKATSWAGKCAVTGICLVSAPSVIGMLRAIGARIFGGA